MLLSTKEVWQNWSFMWSLLGPHPIIWNKGQRQSSLHNRNYNTSRTVHRWCLILWLWHAKLVSPIFKDCDARMQSLKNGYCDFEPYTCIFTKKRIAHPGLLHAAVPTSPCQWLWTNIWPDMIYRMSLSMHVDCYIESVIPKHVGRLPLRKEPR